MHSLYLLELGVEQRWMQSRAAVQLITVEGEKSMSFIIHFLGYIPAYVFMLTHCLYSNTFVMGAHQSWLLHCKAALDGGKLEIINCL